MTTLTGPGIDAVDPDSNWAAPVAVDTLTVHMPALPILVEPAPLPDPADTTPAVGDVTATVGGYVGQHRDPLQREADWTPAHTRAAALRRARIRHARPAGVRPDLRIEKTAALSIERIQQILAGGAS